MGQQQLLLIVLGIIIVGIAIAVGVNMFQASAVDSNRQNVISDLTNLAAKAQRFYRTPQELGGGAQNFRLFELGRLDTANANGDYRLALSAPSTPGAVGGPTQITTTQPDSIFIVGWGQEDGNDGTNKVQAYIRVLPSRMQTVIIN